MTRGGQVNAAAAAASLGEAATGSQPPPDADGAFASATLKMQGVPMDTTTATQPLPPTEPAPPPSRSAGSRALVALAVLCALAVIVPVGLLVGLRLARPGVLPGVVVDGTAVGGLQGEELVAAVERLAARRAARPVVVRRGDATAETTAGEAGYGLDVDATVVRALRPGRQPFPIAALRAHIGAFARTTEVEAVEEVDLEEAAAWARTAAEQLALAPVEGAVSVQGTTISRTDPVPGATVDHEALADALAGALLDDAGIVLDAATTPVEPETTVAAVDEAVAVLERAVSAPVRLVRGAAALEFSPEEIGNVLSVSRIDERLEVGLDPARLAEVVTTEEAAAVGTPPVDARLEVVGDAVQITPSVDGFAYDPASTGAQVLAHSTKPGPREAELAGTTVAPSLSTEQAQALGVIEVTGEFTTQHACCEGRVTNIHRIADLVDNVLIRPGEVFSLNGHVGERTPERGFVEGGAIQEGEFVQQVGGGVSQFTTTMFNAAFFGGYEIVEHKPHSYYISRYPAGREATLNYPTVDFKFRNNSPHGIVVDTSYTGTSITVRFFGTRWVQVEAVEGPRTRPTQPETQVRINPALPPGATRVIQAGGRPGFDITVTRVLTFPDGRVEREEFKTRYLAEARIVERGPPGGGSPPTTAPG